MLDYLKFEDIPESLRDIAEDIGLDAFKKMVVAVGGSSVYFPSVECIVKPARNRLIREKFRGNYRELAKCFGISEVQVRNIVNDR